MPDSLPFADTASHRFGVEDAVRAMTVALDPEASARVLISPS